MEVEMKIKMGRQKLPCLLLQMRKERPFCVYTHTLMYEYVGWDIHVCVL